MVVMIPVIALYSNSALNLRRKILSNAAFLVAGILSFSLYIYGNYIDMGVWEISYTVYNSILGVTVIYVSFCFLFNKDRIAEIPSTLLQRGIGLVTFVFCTIVFVFDISSLFLSHSFSLQTFDLLTIPFLCMLWSLIFVISDLQILIGFRSRDRVFDTESLRAQFKLSQRESEVMELLLRGKRYLEIGEILFISKATVKTYVFRIYKKFGVNSKMQLVNKLLFP